MAEQQNPFEYRFATLKEDGRGPSLAANVLLGLIAGFLVIFVIWAAIAELDRVTRASGRVIPSQQIQVVQNLEGGIVRDILVREGDTVQKGQILVRLDDTIYDSQFKRHQKEYVGLLARIARLEGELNGKRPVYPEEAKTDAPESIDAEQSTYNARISDHRAELDVLYAQLAQRRKSLAEAQVAVQNAETEVSHAFDDFNMIEPLVESGAEPRRELLRAQQRLDAASGELRQLRLTVERTEAAINETQREIQAVQKGFKARAAEELSEVRREFEALIEDRPALVDRVDRTEVRSPVHGIVNRVLVTTVGGVAQPGMPLVEVVPVDDTLLIEARIRPEDIAFLRPGLPARVKITAYDYTRYGVLEGEIEHISADAVQVDKEQGITSYIAHVRTSSAHLPGAGRTARSGADGDGGEGDAVTPAEDLPIIPGMVAEVDIINGKRTVLDYFIRPLLKLKDTAFRES